VRRNASWQVPVDSEMVQYRLRTFRSWRERTPVDTEVRDTEPARVENDYLLCYYGCLRETS
jgi:hypothetical protein